MKEFTVNSHGTNACIKANILPDKEMREVGFTDYAKNRWYYGRCVPFPETKEYRNVDISFGVTIPKDGTDICIDVLDEDFCQPYDYQYMLDKNPNLTICVLVREFVEQQMQYLKECGVIEGHIIGEYI